MKKICLCFLVLIAFLFGSCSDSDSDSDSDLMKILVINTLLKQTQTESYDSDFPIVEIQSDKKYVTVSGDLGGKTVYFVNANKTENQISNKNQRILQNSDASSVQKIYDFDLGTSSGKNDERTNIKNFIPPENISKILLNKKSSASRSILANTTGTSTSEISTVEQITATVDSTTKSIYVDNDVNLSTYTSKEATLRAIGTYCYIWVINDYYTSGSASGSKVDSTIAAKFANKFDEIYPIIRNVFGDESDYLVNYDTSITSYDASLAMSSYSDTGTKVNIVIYDIGDDYSKSNQCGVVGYFYSKDYVYPSSSVSSDSIISKSNKGKYFYVDSAYAVKYFDTTISTLAHEFQHMINFNQKEISHTLSPSTNYNEMLSMICEDMMQEKLGIGDDDSPKARLQGFNTYYFLSGLTEYNESYAAVSYATSYALGAWLCRQYGGAALAQAMSKNDSVDNDSIVAAVNSVNGTSYSFDDLFKQFLLAITGNSTYTLNQNATQSLSYSGYKYPMTAINLWDADYSITSSGISDYSSYQSELSDYKYDGYNWTGPFLFSNSYVYTLRPEYGFTLYGLETLASGTIKKTYTVSSGGSSDLTMYLIIQ